MWGTIKVPTIGDHARLILTFFAETACAWEDLRLWKMDLAGAFTLLSWDPTAVRRMAVELNDDVVIFFLCGIFGWTGMPAVFNVISRTIVWEVSSQLHGEMLMYVDDIFGVCHAKNLQHDMEVCSNFCCSMTQPGPRAVTAPFLDLVLLPSRRLNLAAGWFLLDIPSTWTRVWSL
jgi:hypothetical protein